MIVVKIGGGEGIEVGPVCTDAATLIGEGSPLVIVHGGSHETNVVAERLGHPPRFLTSPSGHTSRRTDRTTLEIFEMVYCGKVNKGVVERLQQLGVNAVGLSGLDGRIWEGRRKEAIRAIENGRTVVVRDDLTGTVDRVNAGLLTTLLECGYVPVITPPAIATNGEAINVDADRGAARTAETLGAQTLVLLSNVPGLFRDVDDPSSLIEHVSREEIDAAIECARGRMKRKVLAAREALEAGVRQVVFADASRDRPIRRALDGEGTVFS